MTTTGPGKRGVRAAGIVVVLLVIVVAAVWLVKSGAPPSASSRPGEGPISTSPAAGPVIARPAMSDAGKETLCRERLERLAGAIRVYRLVHDGRGPVKLSDLYYEGLVEALSDFACPASGAPAFARTEIDQRSDFTLATLAGAPDVVIRERVSRHGTGTILAATADGAVRTVPLPGGPADRPPS